MSETSPYDAVIVLGGGIDAEGNLSPISRSRLDYALSLREREATPIIMTGKWSLLLDTMPPRTEAEAMRDYASAIGTVVSGEILLEEQSMETIGNAYFVKTTIMEPHNWRRAVAVTSEFHIARARQTFSKVMGPGYHIDFVAAPSGLSGTDLLAKQEVETRLLAFTDKLLEDMPAGDDDATLRAMQRLPGYGAQPDFSQQELLQLVQTGDSASETYGLSGK